MPSVFPGMDPYIEVSEWEDFYTRFIVAISDEILPSISPAYTIRIEKRIYVEERLFDDGHTIRPDIAILRERDVRGSRAASAAEATVEPAERTLPYPIEVEEKFLVIRRLDDSEVVTVIELLSPTNKRKGSDGRDEYLSKRKEILHTTANLVELDLLRGGERLPTVEPLPPGDYYALVSRAKRRGKVDVYAWPLSHRLPTIPIPLDAGVLEASLNLQAAFEGVFDRAGYGNSSIYQFPLNPPLDGTQAEWAQSLLRQRTQ